MAKITYNRGTTFSFTNVYQINGIPATTGVKLFFTVKSADDDDPTDSAALVKKTLTMSGASTVITIQPTDIAMGEDDEAGDYIYDIKIQDSVLGLILVAADIFVLNVTPTNRTS